MYGRTADFNAPNDPPEYTHRPFNEQQGAKITKKGLCRFLGFSQFLEWNQQRIVLFLIAQQISIAGAAITHGGTMYNDALVCRFLQRRIVTRLGVRILIRPGNMWRAFFCAVGIVLIIMGIECLLIDSAVLVAGVIDDPTLNVQQQTGGFFSAPIQSTGDRIFKPSEWFPWSLVATGAIVLLYSISLRRTNS
jgi:hypothetical protein